MSVLLLQPPAYWLGFPISKQVSIKVPLNCKINHSKRGSGHFFEHPDIKKLPEPLKDRQAWRAAFHGGAESQTQLSSQTARWARAATCKEGHGHVFLDERKRLNVDWTQLAHRVRVVCFRTNWYEKRDTSVY